MIEIGEIAEDRDPKPREVVEIGGGVAAGKGLDRERHRVFSVRCGVVIPISHDPRKQFHDEE
jgi:hypothetical protein